MNDTIFVGLDVHKATVAVAVAEGMRGGEVHQMGIFPNRASDIAKLVAKLVKEHLSVLRIEEPLPQLRVEMHDRMRAASL